MRAVGLMEHGGPEVLQVVEVPEAQAGPGQVAGSRFMPPPSTRPMSWPRNGSRAEQQKLDPPPYIPGMDAAGIVDQIGDGVTTGVKLGDRVMAMVCPAAAHGAYREHDRPGCPAPWSPAPAGTSHVEACTLPMNGLTARLSLDLLDLETRAKPGGNRGPPAPMEAMSSSSPRPKGLTVIADASEADEALVTALGADIVVRRGDGVTERIRAHFPDGVDGLADGAVQNEAVIGAVRDGGGFTAVRGFVGEPQRDIAFTTTFVRNYDCEWEKLDRLRALTEAGKLTLRVADTYPPERAFEAHARLEAGGTRGRLVIEF